VDADREQKLAQIDAATERLQRTVRGFTDADVRSPSLLPGWTRAHVLAHLVGGAGALRNLLDSARTGVALAAYASQRARDEAIEAGARHDAATLLGEVAAAAGQFRAVATAMPASAWERDVLTPTGAAIPAAELLDRRLVEVELHHTDLDAGYGPADWPRSFTEMELAEPMRGQRAERAGWARG
jgi:maleylpyruvate isomerase